MKKLDALRIQSFVTTVKQENVNTIKGGGDSFFTNCIPSGRGGTSYCEPTVGDKE